MSGAKHFGPKKREQDGWPVLKRGPTHFFPYDPHVDFGKLRLSRAGEAWVTPPYDAARISWLLTMWLESPTRRAEKADYVKWCEQEGLDSRDVVVDGTANAGSFAISLALCKTFRLVVPIELHEGRFQDLVHNLREYGLVPRAQDGKEEKKNDNTLIPPGREGGGPNCRVDARCGDALDFLRDAKEQFHIDVLCLDPLWDVEDSDMTVTLDRRQKSDPRRSATAVVLSFWNPDKIVVLKASLRFDVSRLCSSLKDKWGSQVAVGRYKFMSRTPKSWYHVYFVLPSRWVPEPRFRGVWKKYANDLEVTRLLGPNALHPFPGVATARSEPEFMPRRGSSRSGGGRGDYFQSSSSASFCSGSGEKSTDENRQHVRQEEIEEWTDCSQTEFVRVCLVDCCTERRVTIRESSSSSSHSSRKRKSFVSSEDTTNESSEYRHEVRRVVKFKASAS